MRFAGFLGARLSTEGEDAMEVWSWAMFDLFWIPRIGKDRWDRIVDENGKMN